MHPGLETVKIKIETWEGENGATTTYNVRNQKKPHGGFNKKNRLKRTENQVKVQKNKGLG